MFLNVETDMDAQNVRERELFIENYGFLKFGLIIHTSEGKMHTVFIGKHFLLQLAVFFDFF
jgi:hypothetical protein